MARDKQSLIGSLAGEKMPDNGFVMTGDGGSRNPKVSIIVPCYNCRHFVAEALQSALSQTYGNIEVVVVDDGSTDGSAAIVQNFPVRLFRETHRGVSAARNHGVRVSTGEYLVFLDSDDRLLPGAVAAGVAALEHDLQCGMAVGAHNFITQFGEQIATRAKPVQLRDGYELLLRSNFIECTSSVIFRRSLFNGNDVFRSNLRGAEDYELYLRVARASPIFCHSQVLADYRLHSCNASHNAKVMLTHTLSVLSEQWPFARRSFHHLLAYVYGSLFWRRKYGRQLTLEMAMSDAMLSPQEERAAWRLLAHSYPLGILLVLISRMFPKSLVRSMLLRA
jgi:glycosyltransferase involved in cell wall biosynthesis